MAVLRPGRGLRVPPAADGAGDPDREGALVTHEHHSAQLTYNIVILT